MRKKHIFLQKPGVTRFNFKHQRLHYLIQAYKNFGARVTNMKKRVDDMKKIIPTSPSPVPSPTADAPSPGNSPPHQGMELNMDDNETVDMDICDEADQAKPGIRYWCLV